MPRKSKDTTPPRGRPKEFDAETRLSVTADWLQRIDKAADIIGVNRSTFIRSAAEAAAERILKNEPARKSFRSKTIPPFGYRFIQKSKADPTDLELVEDEREQKAIRLAAQLRVQNYSLREVADELFRKGFKSRTGGRLTPKTINNVLRRLGVRET